jgi:hypothetical protein
VKWLKREVDNSPPCNAEVKNVRAMPLLTDDSHPTSAEVKKTWRGTELSAGKALFYTYSSNLGTYGWIKGIWLISKSIRILDMSTTVDMLS